MGLIQVYSVKTAISMEGGAFLIYEAHDVLLNLSAKYRKNLIHNGHTSVGLLLDEY